MNFTKRILITGGAGFIGSNLVLWMVKKYPNYQIINYDCLTYAGNLANLVEIENEPNYKFVKGDICDENCLNNTLKTYNVSDVIHTAAESHVDRSISDPLKFVKTNVLGTCQLLNSCRNHWCEDLSNHKFYHISTDEVYGSLGTDGFFLENTPYDPHSPYSASKASSDHFVRAFHDTYGMPILISNCSNNYGPYHFPEKLIPLMINNILNNKPLPVYGNGANVRDWLYVLDHATAIDCIFHQGKIGETYNIGGNNEWKNIDLVHLMCDIMDKKLGKEAGSSAKLITFVKDRAGHDLRYAINSSKIQSELGWKPSVTFEEGLEKTIDWFLNNKEWIENITNGEYQKYYETQYFIR